MMTALLSFRNALARTRLPFRLPTQVPAFSDRVYNIFRFIWFAAFALAIIGPAAGIYSRFASPSPNSLLMLGSRAGIAVAESDGTRIRFPVGPITPALGIKPGDDIVAVNGFPVPEVVPVSDSNFAANPTNPVYIMFEDLLYGAEESEVQLRIRSGDGRERDVLIPTGERHIEEGTRALGVPPSLLTLVDLLHVITYPFLLIAAWILNRRNARDVVSSIISLAILLTMCAEQPSASFLASIAQVPRPIHMFVYDMGNICLLAGVLLFPHGKLSARLLVLLASLPVLFFLKGDVYRAVLVMLCAVLMLIGCLRRTSPGDLRQQIKWALFGFCGYAIFLGISLSSDMMKPQAAAFSSQLLLEMTAGLSLGLAFLALQLGLLVALLHYRLYDAEVVISRSATFALVTVFIGAVFAGAIQGLGDTIKSVFGSDAGAGAAGIGAAMATVLISPAYERIHKWMEQRFHKNLLELRRGLPECVRDLREMASLDELLDEVLARIRVGVRTVRSAAIVEGAVHQTCGVSEDEADRWLKEFSAREHEVKIQCDPSDPLFPIRVPLCSASSQGCIGWLVVGPRPDNSSLGDDEREALQEVADPVARAVRIVLKRESNERSIAGLMESQSKRIGALEAMLGVAPAKEQRDLH
jgi:hypothetical protein